MDDLLFSDSWHLVAGQRPTLRPDAPVHRQAFRGEVWHVIGDPYHNRWYRVRPAAWRFLARLDGHRTVEQAWQATLDAEPEHAPGQQEVVQLLAQLYGAALLRGDRAADSTALFERLQSRRTREVQSQLLNFLFLRIPLCDPQPWLERATPLIRAAFSRVGLAAWIALVVTGAALIAGHAGQFADQTRSLLAPGNLGWLYLAWTAMKLCHELAHAAAVRRRGGEVRVLGVMLLVFTPVPYVDASAAWSFRERRDRILVGTAGMMSDLGWAAVAAIVWTFTGQGALNSIAHNLIVLGSVTTLLFNANPLLRFDGYYILCDLIDEPNLQRRASQQLQATVERRIYGRRDARDAATRRGERLWLAAFGLGSGFYRVFVLVAIVVLVAGQWLGLGLLIAVLALVLWCGVPLSRYVQYVVRSPALARCRSRAVGTLAGAAAAAVLLLAIVPFPAHFRTPGVVRSAVAATIVAPTEGIVTRVIASSGTQVRAGTPLLQLNNPELELAVAKAEAQEAEIMTRLAWARETQPAYIEPLRTRLAAAQQQHAELLARRAALVVRAPHDGVWVAPYADEYAGVWVARGVELGTVFDPAGYYFSSVVPQRSAADLFRGDIRDGEVRVAGMTGAAVHGERIDVVAAERTRLATASLGWLGGGEVQVRNADGGRETKEPYFEVKVWLPPADAWHHLRTGTARFTLPATPLLQQGWRAFRQLLQERYQL